MSRARKKKGQAEARPPSLIDRGAGKSRHRSTIRLTTIFVGIVLAILLLVSGYRQFIVDGDQGNEFAVRVVHKNPVNDYLTDVKRQQGKQLDAVKARFRKTPSDFRSTGNLTVHVLDVGHGDAILIITPAGGAILIDGGYEDQGKYVVDYLRGLGLNYLDYSIASHPHADHIGGLDFALKKMAFVSQALDSGKGPGVNASPSDLRTYRSYRRAALDSGHYTAVREDMRLATDDNVELDILVPFEKDSYFPDVNDNSLIVRLRYGNMSFLFTGDCEMACEESLLRKDIRADILKVPHHGAADATSREFLDAVKPKVAIISTGDFERFGHPQEEVLQRLATDSIEVHRTDLEGNILVTTDGSAYAISTISREEASRREKDMWHTAEKANVTLVASNESV